MRPILMTAVATILALLPLALGLSKGSIIAAELGTVVIGGLFSSTVLTLVVVPWSTRSWMAASRRRPALRRRRDASAEPRRRRPAAPAPTA